MHQTVPQKPRALVIGPLAASMVSFRGPLLSELVKRGYDVVASAPDGNDDIVRQLSDIGVRFENSTFKRASANPFTEVYAAYEMWRLVRQVRPDVVFTYAPKPTIYGMLGAWLGGARRRAAMVTGLGYVFIDGPGLKRKVLRWITSTLYFISLRFAHKIIFQNPDDRDEFLRFGILAQRDMNRVALVNGSGVDLSHYAPQPLPPYPIRFLMICRLLIDKGVREYIAAAKIVRQNYPNAVFALAGPLDSNPASLSEEELLDVKAAGVVKYLGELKDVRPELAKAHVFVLPSYREGTPRTVLEAFAVGRAVITTDVPGCRETVRVNQTGWLVEVKSAASLASAMLDAINSPEKVERFSNAALQDAKIRWDSKSVAAGTADLILGAA